MRIVHQTDRAANILNGFPSALFEKCISAITKAIRLWKDWQLVMKTELKPWE
jgi:hypothetical protein